MTIDVTARHGRFSRTYSVRLDLPRGVYAARHTRPARLVRHLAHALWLEDRRPGGPRPAVVAELTRCRERYLAR